MLSEYTRFVGRLRQNDQDSKQQEQDSKQQEMDESRFAKARKVISVLQDISLNVRTARCLDIGCGNGSLTYYLHSAVGWIVGIDLSWGLISQAPSHLNRVQADALRLPFCDATFDLVVCTQVYEHAGDTARLAEEITRILRPGGICYFSGPNRLWPYEYHYEAWLIHWLPYQWLKRLLRIRKHKDISPVTLYTYWQLRRFWKHFALHDYTVRLIRYPDRFPGADVPTWVQYIPDRVLNALVWMTPNVNWVLVKPVDEKRENGKNADHTY